MSLETTDLDATDDLPPAVGAALEAIDDIAFRTGAAVTPAQVALVTEKRGLTPDEAAQLRIAAKAHGYLAGADDTEDGDPVALVARAGSGALQSEFTSLSAFFEAARRYPLLTAEQERALARRFQQGEAAKERLAQSGSIAATLRAEVVAQAEDGKVAKDTFICCNLRLVAKIARGFRGQGLELPDLLQEGILGLIRAVEKFDHALGYKFSTYATWWIRQAIQRALADKGRMIRLPVHVHDLVRKINGVERRLCWELEREPTVRDIAERLSIDAAHVAFLKQAAQSITSLDASIRRGDDDDGTSLLEVVAGHEPSVEDQIIGNDRAERVRAALGRLSHRQAVVLSLRYGLNGQQPHTLDEVGRKMNVTRERIRQIQKQAEETLASSSELGALSRTTTSAESIDRDQTAPASMSGSPVSQAHPTTERNDGSAQRPTAAEPSGAHHPFVDNDLERLRRLDGLTPDERSVMVRRFGIGRCSMSWRQAADDLRRPVAWVMEQESSALAKLRPRETRERAV